MSNPPEEARDEKMRALTAPELQGYALSNWCAASHSHGLSKDQAAAIHELTRRAALSERGAAPAAEEVRNALLKEIEVEINDSRNAGDDSFGKGFRGGLRVAHNIVRRTALSDLEGVSASPTAGSEDTARCTWTENEDGLYLTECGHLYVFETGNAADNGAKFCQYCGKHLTDASRSPEKAP